MWTSRIAIVVPLVLGAVFVPLGSEANAAASIQSITPAQGSITGGTQVTLAGSGFTGTTLTLDGTSIAPSSASDTRIVFRTPVHDNGIVTFKLRGNGPNAYAEFLYVPPRLQDLPPGYITTVAGVGLFTGLYRPATQAEIQPQGSPAFDRQGNMYIPEPGNNRITRVRPDGVLEPFAGSGIPEYQSTSGIGDGGPATEASLTFPRGVTTDATGNVYITEFKHRIRRVDARTGIITTVAGDGNAGFSGDGGPAVQARLNDVSHITGDGNGTLFFIDFDDAASVARVRKITPDGVISTVAGMSPEGFSGDGGPATQAQFNLIMADNGSLALDPQGNLFIVDTGNQRIRRIDARTGIITTAFGPASRSSFPRSVASDSAGNIYFDNDFRILKMAPSGQILATYGNGQPRGFNEDGTPAIDATINGQPGAVDSLGNIIFLDDMHRVRRINIGTGRLETLAGMKSRSIGESGPAIATTLQISNAGLALLPSGELLVGDGGHNMVRKIDANGTISTFGQGGYPGFPEGKGWESITYPISVKTDPSGQVFVSDTRKVYRVDVTGQVHMIAGTGVSEQYGYSGDGGPAIQALLCQPWDVALDGAGNLFIADTNNNRIRRVDAQTGIITTVAGSGPVNGFEHYGSDGHGGFSGDGGPAAQATLNTPYGVAVDAQGNLFIADADNGRIRKVDTNGIITTFATNGVDKLAFDGAGNLYSLSGAGLIRYDPAGRSTQLLGQGSLGFSGDGGPALQSRTRTHAQSASVAIDAEGNVFFVDAGNLRVRAVRYGAVIAEPGSTVTLGGGSSQTATIGSAFPVALLQVTLNSPAATPENGIRVDFAAPGSGASCTFPGGSSSYSTLTDVNGQASASCTSNAQAGSYSVTATPLALGQSVRFALTNAPDNQTQAIPDGLRATRISDTQINLSWNPAGGNAAVTSYKLYRNGTLLAALGKVTSYADAMLSPSSAYSYTLQACNAAGTCSAQSAAASASTSPIHTDIRAYIPEALSSAGYRGFLRVINTSSTATPVTVALIDGDSGSVGTAGTLAASLAPGAAVTFSAIDIERVLGTAIAAEKRPRIRVGTQQSVEVQSFMANPGGIMTQISGAQSGTTVDVRSYLPYALNTLGYVSAVRLINTGTSAAAVRVALIDGNSGAIGASAVLNPALPPGAAMTYLANQVEAALGVSLDASARPRLRVSSTGAIEVQSFMSNPGGAVTESDGAVANSNSTPAPYSVDVRSYIPAGMTGDGYNGFLRIINTSPAATPVSVALIDADSGAVGAAATLAASLPPGAAVTFSAADIEHALGTAIVARSRPRIRVGTQQRVEVQSFMANPGGIMTQLSGAQGGTTIDVRSYLPYALSNSGYMSFLRVINTGSSATPVQVALIDGNSGAVGNFAVLNPALPPGAAITYSAQQVEAALGVVLDASARPRLRVTSTSAIEVQSFMSNPGGAVTEADSVQ